MCLLSLFPSKMLAGYDHDHHHHHHRHARRAKQILIATVVIVCMMCNFLIILRPSSSSSSSSSPSSLMLQFDAMWLVSSSTITPQKASSSCSDNNNHNASAGIICDGESFRPRVVFLGDGISPLTVLMATRNKVLTASSTATNDNPLRESNNTTIQYHHEAFPLAPPMHEVRGLAIDNGVEEEEDERYNKNNKAVGNDGFGDDCFWNEWQTAHHPTCNDAHALPMNELMIVGSGILEQLGAVTYYGFEAIADIIMIQDNKQQTGTGLLAFTSGGQRIAGLLNAPVFEGRRREGAGKSLPLVYKTQHLVNNPFVLADRLKRAHMEAIISELFPETTTQIFGHCGLFSLTAYGSSFVRAVRDGQLDPLQKLSLSMQFARAVGTLHNRQSTPVIYQDFSEGNVVLADGQVKLIDFGNAALVPEKRAQRERDRHPSDDVHGDNDNDNANANHTSSSYHPTKMCYPHMESYNYIDIMPLELIQRRRDLTTEQINVYGLGSMFFYLLTDGARMYHCENPRGVCNYYFKWKNSIPEEFIYTLKENGTLPSLPTSVQTSEHPAIRAILETMNQALQKNPLERPTAQEILHTLERACQELKCPSRVYASLPSPPPPPPPPSGSQLPRPECEIPKSRKSKKNVTEPVYVASYPGSGSELMLNLIEAFTGTMTRSHGGRCCEPPELPYDYVALKTHYPWCCPNNFTHGLLSSAIVLIRNPLNALPSKANREYESNRGIASHSRQCPEAYWKEWRDANFDVHFELWAELIEYWYDSYSNSSRIILPYEEIVNQESGAALSSQLCQFLTRTGVVNDSEMTSERVSCLWEKIVVGDQSGRRSKTHRTKSYIPTYTSEQYHSILKSLLWLLQKYENESFGPALVHYKNEVVARLNQPPKVAWLLSYPNSYNTQIRTLLQTVTNTTGGTNYGHERIKSNGKHSFNSESISVYPGESNGPFIVNPDLPLPRSGGFILVKTHCGVNGCRDCNVPPPDEFVAACALGTSVDGNGNNLPVKYDSTIVERAVHLYLNPFSNVLTRFNGPEKAYPKTREGLVNWCRDYDQMYVHSGSDRDFIPADVLNRTDVLCHSEFFKYVQWHNNAISTVQHLNLHAHVLYAEDFSASNKTHSRTIPELLNFLELPQVASGYSFETKSFVSYFTYEQAKSIISFIRQYASQELWHQISVRYFLGNFLSQFQD